MKGNRRRREIYRLVTLVYPRSSTAEAYRTLRANIEFASVDSPTKTLLVTSPSQGEGKTTTAANLAVAFAQAGKRTVLVDADLRKPGAHRIFNLPNRRGLTSLLLAPDVDAGIDRPGNRPGRASDHHQRSTAAEPGRAPGLRSIPRDPASSLARSSTSIVLDSPPVSAVADAAILASIADVTIVVVQAGRTKSGHARHSREALAKAGARVLGAVINRVPKRSVETFYYAYGGYGDSDVVVMPYPPARQGGVQ